MISLSEMTFASAMNGKFVPELVKALPELAPMKEYRLPGGATLEERTSSTLKGLYGVIGNSSSADALWVAGLLLDWAIPVSGVYQHAHKGAQGAIPLLKNQGLSYEEARKIVSLIENHDFMSRFEGWKGSFSSRCDALVERIPYLEDEVVLVLCEALAEKDKATVGVCLDILRQIGSAYYSPAQDYVEHVTTYASWEENGWYGSKIERRNAV